MTTPALALVTTPEAPEASPAPAAEPALTPDATLRALAARLGSNPFASDGRTNKIRAAGTALQAAMGKLDAARDHAARCEAVTNDLAERALALLTE